MRILHLGNLQVVPALRALGHDVRVASELCPLLVARGRPVDVRLLYREIAPDADAFFMVDTLGRQTLAYGIEELPIPRLYWAIDVHLNLYWQRPYARLFDLVLTAQKDYVRFFAADGVPARWLPWGIDPTLFRVDDQVRTTDLVFVGVVDANRPKRAAAVAELRRRFGLVTFGVDANHRLAETDMARVFGSAKIVFNESVFGDLNFRTFEAMACGALLLTERIGNGLVDLFTPGTHLAVYSPDDLIDQVEHYLSSSRERERIAAAGRELVLTRHTMAARMAEVTDVLAAGVVRREGVATAPASFGVAAQLTIASGLSDPNAQLRLAVESLRTATLAGTDVDAAISLAELMLYAGRDDGALVALGVARTARADDPRAWLLAGAIEHRRGRVAEAVALWRDGVSAARLPATLRHDALAALADPGSAAASFALGLVLQAHGLLFVPGLPRQTEVGLPRTAVDYFVQSVAREPNALPVLEHAACVLELAGCHEFAREFRERQVQCAPADPNVRARYARVLAQSYMLEASVHHARVACALAGEDGVTGTAQERWAAYREAGIALQGAGAGPRALALFERAAGFGDRTAAVPVV
jgi:glycosyltransferase involved in cell wall biosynthesis/tetratricopeptide (TPR) repeat protein